MRLNRALIALAAWLVVAAAPAAVDAGRVGEPVTLNDRVTVERDVIVLGDIFTGLLEKADTPIARAPEPGNRVRLNARWLARVAKAYRVDWQPRSLAVETTVRRASHLVGEGEIASAIVDALRERGVEGDVSVSFDNGNLSLRLPTDVPPTVSIANLSYNPSNNRFSANIHAPDSNEPRASSTVTGRVVRMIEIPVPARRIERGDIIVESDLEWRSVPAGQMNRNHIADADTLVGKSARRPIGAGHPVRTTDVERERLVSKNSLVTIELRSDRMQLSAQGRALDHGAKGDVVRVMNTNSSNTVSGVVAAADTVVVQPQSGRLASAAR